MITRLIKPSFGVSFRAGDVGRGKLLSLTLFGAVALTGSLHGDVIASDDFEDYQPGRLEPEDRQNNGGAGWTTAFIAVPGGEEGSLVLDQGLAYTNGDIDIDGGDRAAVVFGPNNYNNLFRRGIPVQDGGDIWFRFLFRQSGIPQTGDFLQFWISQDGTEANSGSLGVLSISNSNFGVRSTPSNASGHQTSQANTAVAKDETYLLVGRISASGSTYDTVELWINPNSLTDPGGATETVSRDLETNSLGFFGLRTFGISGDTVAFFDEVVIASEYAELFGPQ